MIIKFNMSTDAGARIVEKRSKTISKITDDILVGNLGNYVVNKGTETWVLYYNEIEGGIKTGYYTVFIRRGKSMYSVDMAWDKVTDADPQ